MTRKPPESEQLGNANMKPDLVALRKTRVLFTPEIEKAIRSTDKDTRRRSAAAYKRLVEEVSKGKPG